MAMSMKSVQIFSLVAFIQFPVMDASQRAQEKEFGTVFFQPCQFNATAQQEDWDVATRELENWFKEFKRILAAQCPEVECYLPKIRYEGEDLRLDTDLDRSQFFSTVFEAVNEVKRVLKSKQSTQNSSAATVTSMKRFIKKST